MPSSALNHVEQRDAQAMLQQALQHWRGALGAQDLWIFGYASLLWRPEFSFSEQRAARVRGYHRALKMWSHVNRGTPERPGLVFALLPGGSCAGLVFRIPAAEAEAALCGLWPREMPMPVYDPKWLRCHTAAGPVTALAFTLSRRSPSYTGELSIEEYRRIFSDACGHYGTTREYAELTHQQLGRLGISDRALARLLRRIARPASA